MIIWFSFVFVALTICFISIIEKHKKRRFIILQLLLICFVSWFAGFRDGLGEDYSNYDGFLNSGLSYLPVNYLLEPAYSLFSVIVFLTILSSVFYFLSMALITNYLIIKYFYNFKFVIYIVFIYLTSGYYFGSFNLVRQVCAASIFLYSTIYIEKRMFFKFLIAILIAASFHLSAIFLIPFYMIGNIKTSKYYDLSILAISFIIGWVIKFNVEGLIPNINFYYNYYLNREETLEGSGFFIYLFNITLLLILLGKNKIPMSNKNTIALNFALIGVVIYNLSGSFYFLFRFASYFQLFIIIVTPMLIYIYQKSIVKISIILLYSFIFIYFITNNKDNPRIIPQKILPLSDIIDH